MCLPSNQTMCSYHLCRAGFQALLKFAGSRPRGGHVKMFKSSRRADLRGTNFSCYHVFLHQKPEDLLEVIYTHTYSLIYLIIDTPKEMNICHKQHIQNIIKRGTLVLPYLSEQSLLEHRIYANHLRISSSHVLSYFFLRLHPAVKIHDCEDRSVIYCNVANIPWRKKSFREISLGDLVG